MQAQKGHSEAKRILAIEKEALDKSYRARKRDAIHKCLGLEDEEPEEMGEEPPIP